MQTTLEPIIIYRLRGRGWEGGGRSEDFGRDHSILGRTEGGGGPVINADPSRGDHSTC